MADLLDHIGPFVSFSTITRFRGIISCLVLSVAYVGSLYVLKSPYPRDHPKTIRQRFRSVFVISLLAPLYVWLWADGTSDLNILSLWKYLGIHLENILIATLFPLILTAILFLGPIMLLYFSGESVNMKGFLEYPTSWVNSINLRNYFVAPLTEEFVYRACLVPMLVPSFGNVLPIFICPLFFGVAHIHHVIERLKLGENPKDVWSTAIFQFGYTTVFGGYTAFLFLRTGHLIGPVLCHSFCNFMGFPPIDQVPSSKYPRLISGSFVAGLVLFLVLAVPLTNPSWYNSVYYRH
ncbi:CAAX prenyl protease [Desmophyllum pertusum]|uniref:CAAX prenyl protease 2 n=1 Tax=Desmophyllum pertusum TaxID=174260 RepID=A0A9W9YLC9_9CNID|nr:CAAX prenyl protease [Desmophyllum pertusum]